MKDNAPNPRNSPALALGFRHGVTGRPSTPPPHLDPPGVRTYKRGFTAGAAERKRTAEIMRKGVEQLKAARRAARQVKEPPVP